MSNWMDGYTPFTVCGRDATSLRRRTTRGCVRGLMLTVSVSAVLILALFVCASALAGYARPFARQIAETGGLAIGPSGNLWASENNQGPPFTLREFDQGGNPLETLTLEEPNPLPPEGVTPPGSISVDDATGSFYVTDVNATKAASGYGEAPSVEVFSATGKFIEGWREFGRNAHVAVDNSTSGQDPSACLLECTVYVAHAAQNPGMPLGNGRPEGIEKLSATGKDRNFTISEPYLASGEITGTPRGPFGYEAVQGIAVDEMGNIYVADRQYESSAAAVLEYRPGGEFVRAIGGEETPGVGESRGEGGWGGWINDVAIDPASHHLLVSITQINDNGQPIAGAVDEFDLASGRYLGQLTTGAEGKPLLSAKEMAVDPAGDLYVADEARNVIDEYEAGRFTPGVRLGESAARTPTSATLQGEVNPESLVNPEAAGLSECVFQYVSEAQFQGNVQAHGGAESEGFSSLTSGGESPCVPGAGEISADSSWHAVHAALSGLQSGITYRYRMVARTSGALGGSKASTALAFTAPHAPLVEPGSTQATNISSTFVDLGARISALGAATSYQFQYVTQDAYETSGFAGAQLTPETSIGSGEPTGGVVESVIAHVGGLVPGTTYEFRALAGNAFGVSDGETVAFTELAQAAPGLPDARAYELVTPANKEGGSDMFAETEVDGEFFNVNNVAHPSAEGNALLLETKAAFGPFPAATENTYVFSRGPRGWSFHSLASPTLGVQAIVHTVFDPLDLSRVAFNDNVGTQVGAGGASETSMVGSPGGSYVTLFAGSVASDVDRGRSRGRRCFSGRYPCDPGRRGRAAVPGRRIARPRRQGALRMVLASRRRRRADARRCRRRRVAARPLRRGTRLGTAERCSRRGLGGRLEGLLHLAQPAHRGTALRRLIAEAGRRNCGLLERRDQEPPAALHARRRRNGQGVRA